MEEGNLQFSDSGTDVKQNIDRKPRKKRPSNSVAAGGVVTYHGLTIAKAAMQGNLPVCVLLWGMAAAKRLNLMVPDAQGNNPMHFAALADSPEVKEAVVQRK